MESDSGCGHNDVDYSNVEMDIDPEPCDMPPTVIETGGEGASLFESELGEAAAAVDNVDEGGNIPSIVENRAGDGDGDHERPPQEAPEAAEIKQYRIRVVLTALEVQELENSFQQWRYPNLFQRQQLAERLCVTESRVQVWFQNRRAKWRRHQRATRLRNLMSLVFGTPMGVIVDGPYAAIRVVEPAWIFVPLMLVPIMPLGLPPPYGPFLPPGPPQRPRLPIIPVPAQPRRVPIMPMPPQQHVPPFAFAPVDVAWGPVINGGFPYFPGPFF